MIFFFFLKKIIDDADLDSFFVSYQMAVSPREMFDAFILCHTELSEDNTIDSNDICEKSKRFISHLIDSETIDNDITSTISAFISKTFSSNMMNDLKMKLMKYRHSVSLAESPVRKALEEHSIFKSSRELFKLNDKLSCYPEDGILAFPSTQMAENLTLLESALISNIKKEEYYYHTKPEKSPNIKILANHFDNISLWVITEIFSAEPIRQISVLKKFINLAVKLLDLKNYNGSMEILCALNNSTIQRYKKLWDNLPTRYVEILNHVEQTLTPLRNFRSYRNALAATLKSGQPCIPYIAAHLKDLIYANEGNPTTLSNGLLSLENLTVVGNIIKQLLNAGKHPFTFQPKEDCLKFFTNLCWLNNQDLRSCSLSLESKRENEQIQINTIELADETIEFTKCKEELSKLSCSSQRNGILPGFLKELHSSTYEITKFLFNSKGLECKTRLWRGIVYKNCFSGYEAINIIIASGLVDNRRAAIEIGTKLLKDNYILYIGKNSNTNTILPFSDKYGSWYQFNTEDIPGFEEKELREAQKIIDMQERTDRCILIAISSSTGGIKSQIFWYFMESVKCFSGADLVAWLSDNMKIPREESIELCSRLFKRNFLLSVSVGNISESFFDSTKHFYQFNLIRPKQIIKQTETRYIEPSSKNRKVNRKMRGLSKQGSMTVLNDLNISKDEFSTLCVMLDPFAGIPPDVSTTKSIIHWKGTSIIRWLCKYLNTSEQDATKFAASLHDRKILLNSSDKEKKAPSTKLNTLYHLPVYVISSLTMHKERSSPLERRSTIAFGVNPVESKGPVLYERGAERSINDEQSTNESSIFDDSSNADSNIVETHKILGILFEMCNPISGIKRSEVRFGGQTRKLFSGQKFILWLENHKKLMINHDPESIFEEFASRGFIKTLSGEYPNRLDSDDMYRFAIERGDGEINNSSNNSSRTLLAASSNDDLDKDPIELTTDPEQLASIQALVQSRMGSIENPIAPVVNKKGKSSKVKQSKKQKSSSKKTNNLKSSTNANTYVAPIPGIKSSSTSEVSQYDESSKTKDDNDNLDKYPIGDDIEEILEIDIDDKMNILDEPENEKKIEKDIKKLDEEFTDENAEEEKSILDSNNQRKVYESDKDTAIEEDVKSENSIPDLDPTIAFELKDIDYLDELEKVKEELFFSETNNEPEKEEKKKENDIDKEEKEEKVIPIEKEEKKLIISMPDIQRIESSTSIRTPLDEIKKEENEIPKASSARMAKQQSFNEAMFFSIPAKDSRLKQRSRSKEKLGKFLRTGSSTETTQVVLSPRLTDKSQFSISQSFGESIAQKMMDSENGVKLSTNKVKKKNYHKSFTGTEVCTWLNQQILTDPEMEQYDPLILAQELLAFGFFESLNNKNKCIFEAGNVNIYRMKTPGDEKESKKKKRGKIFK